MSNLLSQASLVMIPSGYKEDVVYSAIPTNGSGDLSFTRASNGTRVNSAGLVEVVAWNLAQYSEQPTNAVWTKQNSGTTFTLTDNFTTAPNGTTTACKYTWTAMDSAGKYFSFYQPITNSVGDLPVTFSVYMKGALGGEKLYIYGNSYEGLQLVTLTTEWVRYEITFDTSSGNILGFIGGEFGAGGMTTLAAGTAYVWGAQLNIGSTAKPYFPTTDRLNVPRLTYQNGGGGCPSLLLEKQSTNLVTYSEEFDNAAWTKNVSVTANAIISPDGTQNADKILESSSNVAQWAYQSFAMSGAQTATIYAKKGERNYIALATAGLDFSYFNLDTGVVVSTASGATTSIQNAGNGWYRCSVNASTPTSSFFIVAISDNGTQYSYAGDTSKGVYVWGAQNEASSYPTSYIPTTSSSATRVADVCSKTGISSLIGQTSGTVFVDAYIDNIEARANNILFYLSGTSVDKYVLITNAGGVRFIDFPNGNITDNGYGLTNGRHKFAIAYANNDFAFYIDGNLIGTDNSGTPCACSEFGFFYYTSGYDFPLKVNESVLFTTRLSNSELASLTSL